MATNTLATPLWVTKEVARGYVNGLTMLANGNVNREYDDSFVVDGAKVGDTVKARMPQRWEATDGQAIQLQAIYDQTVNITLTNQKNVAFGYSSSQATTDLDNIRQRYTQPAADTLAGASEVLFANAVYRDIWNSVGTPGVTPNSALTFLQAGVKLTDGATPLRGRKGMIDPMAMATLANALGPLFNPQSSISAINRTGMMSSQMLGIDTWDQDPAIPKHVTGTFTASTPLVNGASQTGSTLVTDGWASGAASLKRGDSFTIGGVSGWIPQLGASTGRLLDFVVTADISDTTGAMTLGISPSIITSGQLRTVDVSPADNAVITVRGATSATAGTLATTTSPQSLIYQKDFATFVMADLKAPNAGASSTSVRSKPLGFMIRFVEQYQIATDQNLNRLDILIGAAILQPRLAARVWG